MIKVIREIRKHINYSQPGSCTAFAFLFSRYLVESKNDQKAYVVEGFVLKNRQKLEHTWVVFENKIIDPTFAQFKLPRNKTKRIEKSRYTPEQYVSLEDEFLFYTDILNISK